MIREEFIKMRKGMKKRLLIILMALVISDISSIPVYAKDSVSYSSAYARPTKSDEQWRFITVVKDPLWTKLVTVEGQPTKGTYLKKGDSLFYGENGGKSIPISVGVTIAKVVSVGVGFNIPMGKAYNTYYGKSLKADKSGYYIIKAKKKIQPTIKFIQYRHKQNGYLQNGKWGSWEKAKYYGKNYKVVKAYSTLVKQ
jgi:hypothetical protein